MTLPRSLRPATVVPLLAACLAACGAAPDSADSVDAAVELDPATACNTVSPSPAHIAVLDYISTADPKPLRYLNAVSSDSALPADVERLVQDKGPTFYWLPDDKAQAQIREKLGSNGSWPSMLVVIRENSNQGDGTAVVRVGGHYVGRPNDGVESPEKRYVLRCIVSDSSASWTSE